MSKAETTLRRHLIKTRDSIRDKIKATEQLLCDILNVEETLRGEHAGVLQTIDERANTLRKYIDAYVAETKTAVNKLHDQNLENLNREKQEIKHNRVKNELNVEKLDEALEIGKQNQTGKPLVNVTKVYEMVVASIEDTTSLHVDVDVTRCKIVRTRDIRMDDVSEMIGQVATSCQALCEMMHPVSIEKEFATPKLEISALSTRTTKSSSTTWACFGAKTELIKYNQDGNQVNKIQCQFKINDIIQMDDGRIVATSPDSKSVRCFSRKKKQSDTYTSSVLMEDSLYLHGLCLCNKPGLFAVCATDMPNYTDRKPNETVIVEYTFGGKGFRRIMVSEYVGKVYRIAQNIDDNYVLTFPKEGAILSVDNVGNIRNSFTKQQFFACPLSFLDYGDDRKFWPSGVSTDVTGHVIVSEYINKVVLMLDKHLNMLRCIGSNHKGPNALTYDRKLHLLLLGDKERLQVWRTCGPDSQST